MIIKLKAVSGSIPFSKTGMAGGIERARIEADESFARELSESIKKNLREEYGDFFKAENIKL